MKWLKQNGCPWNEWTYAAAKVAADTEVSGYPEVLNLLNGNCAGPNSKMFETNLVD